MQPKAEQGEIFETLPLFWAALHLEKVEEGNTLSGWSQNIFFLPCSNRIAPYFFVSLQVS